MKKTRLWMRLLPRILESMAGSQNLLTPGPADGLAVGRQGPRSRLCLRTRLLPALTRPPALAGRPLRAPCPIDLLARDRNRIFYKGRDPGMTRPLLALEGRNGLRAG